jgi:hypothetical protein
MVLSDFGSGLPGARDKLKGLPFSPKTRFGYTGGLSEQNDTSEQNDVLTLAGGSKRNG